MGIKELRELPNYTSHKTKQANKEQQTTKMLSNDFSTILTNVRKKR